MMRMMINSGFDFFFGRWNVHNRFLNGRLCGSADWTEFAATLEAGPILGGAGNMDSFHANLGGKAIEGSTVRLFNPTTGLWTIYWADNVRPGAFYPPMIGKWNGDTAEFFGGDQVDGRAVRSRFRWSRADPDRPTWEQAFSAAFSDDDGATWETNWVMTFTRREVWQ